VPKHGEGKEESKITQYERRNGKMTKLQKRIIACAYLDLIGAREARDNDDIESHDWKAHQVTVEEMENAFEFIKEKTK
jgi:hypothetical protein